METRITDSHLNIKSEADNTISFRRYPSIDTGIPTGTGILGCIAL